MVKFDNETRNERVEDPENFKEIRVWCIGQHKEMVPTVGKEWAMLKDRRWSARLN